MSLMLRKACEPVLESAQLGKLHATISDNAKNLRIVTECGKPFLNVVGITFNRAQPTGAEIEYCVELLEEFLFTHKALLSDYANKIKILAATDEVEQDNGTYKVSANIKYGEPVTYGITYWDGVVRVYIFGKKISLALKDEARLGELTTFKSNPTLFKAAEKYLVSYAAYQKKIEAVDDARSELNKCDI